MTSRAHRGFIPTKGKVSFPPVYISFSQNSPRPHDGCPRCKKKKKKIIKIGREMRGPGERGPRPRRDSGELPEAGDIEQGGGLLLAPPEAEPRTRRLGVARHGLGHDHRVREHGEEGLGTWRSVALREHCDTCSTRVPSAHSLLPTWKNQGTLPGRTVASTSCQVR